MSMPSEASSSGAGEADAETAGSSRDAAALCPPCHDGALCHDGEWYDSMVGISHIWVERGRRRSGVARELLEAVRRHFATGFDVPLDKLAFSQPTAAGRRLAASYSGTEAFLVYE